MKKILAYIAAALALLGAGISCKDGEETIDSYSNAKLAFDAWMLLHHPELTALEEGGIFPVQDIPGTGETVKEDDYVFVKYCIRSLEDSAYLDYNEADIARKMRAYDKTYYYGPEVILLSEGSASQGWMDTFFGKEGVLDTMRVGGYRETVVPGWLGSTSSYYDTKAEYIANCSGTNSIINVRVTDRTQDINQWQIDSILRTGRVTPADSCLGHAGKLFYKRNLERELQRKVTRGTDTLPSDTTIYVNYIGRLIDGTVFDTNIKDTAKVWGLYDSSSSYTPQSVAFSSDSTALTLGGSTTIDGFSLTIFRMHAFESGTGIFVSDYGYGYSGSGYSIPAYAPLIFEIDIVEKPDSE